MGDMFDMNFEDFDASSFDDPFGAQLEVIKLVVFLIDTSASMEGQSIGIVNALMEELIQELDDPQIRLAVAEIHSDVVWNDKVAVEVEEYGNWVRKKGDSLSHLGQAFQELADRLADEKWCQKGTKKTEGYFVLLSDGYSTDDCVPGLEALNKVEAFAQGKKMACCFSNIKDLETLNAFVGDTGKIVELSQNTLMGKNEILSMIELI